MSIQHEPESDIGRKAKHRALVDPAIWLRQEMRIALAARDIGAVQRLLQRFGVSQRRIAAATEQSQGEVSEIIAGRRWVVAYDVLVRIAEGLGVPRGWMGLAFDDDPEGPCS